MSLFEATLLYEDQFGMLALRFATSLGSHPRQRHFPQTPKHATHRLSHPFRAASTTDNMSIQEYIEEHALGKKVEDVINAAVKAKAAEPLSFMVSSLCLGS